MTKCLHRNALQLCVCITMFKNCLVFYFPMNNQTWQTLAEPIAALLRNHLLLNNCNCCHSSIIPQLPPSTNRIQMWIAMDRTPGQKLKSYQGICSSTYSLGQVSFNIKLCDSMFASPHKCPNYIT